MGYLYVNAVLNGLSGQRLKLPEIPKGSKPWMKKEIDANAIALLVAIANRQPNPGSYHGDLDPICIGNKQKLADESHVKDSTFDNTRNFLVKLGVLKHNKTEKHKDPMTVGEMKEFTNVYRINLDFIRALHPNRRAWVEDILRIDEQHDQLSDDVLRALKAAPESLAPAHEMASPAHPVGQPAHPVDSTTHPMDSKTHPVGTNKNIKQNKQQQQHHGMEGLPVDDVNLGWLNRTVNAIAEKAACEVDQVNRKTVWDVIRDKGPDAVHAAITNAKIGYGIKNPVGLLINILRGLVPKAALPPPSEKEKLVECVEIISKIGSPDVKSLVNTAVKNIGTENTMRLDLQFLQSFLGAVTNALLGLVKTDEGKIYAVEVVDAAKPRPDLAGNKVSIEEVRRIALWLVETLKNGPQPMPPYPSPYQT